MKKLLSFILTAVVFISLAGCKANNMLLTIEIPRELKPQWQSIISDHPLPGYIEITDQISDENGARIVLESTFSKDAGSGNTAAKTVIKRQWFVPTAKLWDTRTDIKCKTVQDLDLVPLENVILPSKALSINGLYIDSSSYPAVKTTTLSLFIETNKDRKTGKKESGLIQWFRELSEETEASNNQNPDIVWIAGVGDIMVQRGVENMLLNSQNGINTVFGNTLVLLQNMDLLMGNLEGSITLNRKKISKSYNFKFKPEVLSVLYRAGFDYLSLTNNHIYDYGKAGFIDSLNYMKSSRIATSGAGMTVEEAAKYWETTIRGQQIRVLSLGAYPKENNGFDGKTQASVNISRPGILFEGTLADTAISEMVSEDTFDILFIHGGREWTSVPTEKQKFLYRKYIDMGVDLILGSHPHVLQGLEAYKGKLISYSLGNFIFPGMSGMLYAENSMILSVGIVNGRIKYVAPVPVKITGKTIQLDKNTDSLNRFMNLIKGTNK